MGEVIKLKESHPVQTAEFSAAQGINHEPTFKWWDEHVLKKKDGIIASIRNQQTRYLKNIHKFGIELPKIVEQALTLDAKNENTLWAGAISKVLENVRVAFEILPNGKKVPIGHQLVR